MHHTQKGTLSHKLNPKYIPQMLGHTAQDDEPLELDMWGINLYTGGHYDNYIVHYTSYRAGSIPEAVFSKPDLCAEKPVLAHVTEGWRHDLHAQIASFLPNAYYGASLPLPVRGCHLLVIEGRACHDPVNHRESPLQGNPGPIRVHASWSSFRSLSNGIIAEGTYTLAG